MKKEITEKQRKELEIVAAMSDEDIDLSDIPAITEWKGAVVGKFYRPIKQAVTIRLDADVIDWLRHGGRGYQTRINTLLRSVMENQKQKKAA
jgi:uncharacterized protein (DUF4415 family)